MEIKMESNLIKQLEDKKKELLDIEQGIKILEMSECSKDSNCHEYSDLINEKEYYRHCKEIIAILEQAIAEMQKQRQEILEDIEEIMNEFVNDSDIDGRKICFEFHDTDLFELRDKLSKLNQPKTEKSKNETFKYKGRLNKLW
jgi:hypothetical protein